MKPHDASARILGAVHNFPGDELVPPPIYRRTILNGYVSTALTLGGAAESCGFSADAATFERWKRLGAAAGLVDAILDENDIRENNTLYQFGLEYFASGDADSHTFDNFGSPAAIAVYLLHNSTKDLSKEQKKRLYEAARKIGDIAVQKTTCGGIRPYIQILQEEASAAHELICGVVSTPSTQKPDFELFSAWCKSAIQFGIFGDSARDLGDDYRKERTRIPPTLAGRLKLVKEAATAGRELVHPYRNCKATFGALTSRAAFSVLATTKTLQRRRDSLEVS